MKIPFNQVYLTGDEEKFIAQTMANKKIGAGGEFTKRTVDFFEKRYQFGKCFLTTSCTSALEMAALLLDVRAGDEIIVPAYTFVSTANAFALKGAQLVFADSQENHPNIDANRIAQLITEKTKAIVVVHYAGDACEMKKITALCRKHNLALIEDAAQAINSFYKHEDGSLQALGSFGDFATFSFHESKNITCGEGGMLVINNPTYIERAEVVYQKGTNRTQFLKNEIDKYEWVDLGSSYAISELNAAFLWAQLLHLDEIQAMRKEAWSRYFRFFKSCNLNQKLPSIPNYSVGNAHIFFLLSNNRATCLEKLAEKEIQATFHFSSLNQSPYFETNSLIRSKKNDNADQFSQQLIRLPLYNAIQNEQIDSVLENF